MTLTRQQVIDYLNSTYGNDNYQLYTLDDATNITEEYWNSCEWGQIDAPFNKVSPPTVTWKELIDNV
jgi:hypothetical protein